MWLVKVFSVMYLTAVCAAQEAPRDPPTPNLKLMSPWNDVFQNETVQFTCEVNDPNWTFSWFKNQKKLDANYVYELEADIPSLNITEITADEEGDYACKAELGGVSSESSNKINIIVYENIPTPKVSQDPSFTLMYMGETVKFTCNVDIASGWSYQWYKDEIELPETSQTISIILQPSDKSKYSCVANRGETTTDPSEGISQDVLEIPVPSLTQKTPWLDVFPDESVQLSCGMSDSSDWIYTWHKDGQEVKANPDVSFDSNRATLSIKSASAAHEGLYTCSANLIGRSVRSSLSSGLPLTVYGKKPSVTLIQDPDYKTMFSGESVSFNCDINVSTGWEFLWYKDGTKLAETGNKYTIKSVETTNQGSYECQAKRGANQAFSTASSQAIRLAVQSKKPSVTLIQDPDYKTMFSGESISFNCHINVSTGWEFLWYKDGTKLAETGNKFTIKSVETTNQGSYECQAKRGANQAFSTASSQAIRLAVQNNKPKPVMTQQPDVDKVYIGESVSITCKVELTSGWEYSWFKDGVQQSIKSNVFGISAVSLSDRGTYDCMATRNKTMYATVHSDKRTLQVSEIPVPSLTQKTPWLDVFPDESVQLSCGMSDSSDWIYTWHKDGQEVKANPDVSFDSNRATLSIKSASAAHEGLYTCSANINGRSVRSSLSSGLQLRVYGKKPSVTLIQDPDYKTMFSGESISFNCHINVSTGWEFLWYKDGTKLAETGNKFTIKSVETTNQGSYECQAKRGANQAFSTASSQAIRLAVQNNKPKPVMTQQPDVDKVYIGESVSITCKVELTSGWEYSWFKDGVQQSIKSNVFPISAVSLSDRGIYDCMATRNKTMYATMHSDKRTLQVFEIPVPSLTQKTPWLDVFPDESVQLSCGMSDSSDWIYTWHKDGQEVKANPDVSFDSNRATLSIKSASAAHKGQYTCSANINGRSVRSIFSSGLNLSVYGTKPRVTLMQNPSDNVLHTGDSVSFSCHINVSTGWEYMWYKDDVKLDKSGNNHTISSVMTKNTGTYKCQTKRGRNPVFQSDPAQAVKLDIKERPQAVVSLLTGWSEVFSTDNLVFKCVVKESEEAWNYTWFKEDQPINEPPKERYIVTPQNNPEQSQYACQGIRNRRPFTSKPSNLYKTNNLLLKRRVLLSILGVIFFSIIALFIGCIVLKVTRKPAKDEYRPEETELFFTMAQQKDCDDTPCPLVQYITDAALNTPPKEEEENGKICSDATPLPITQQEDEAVKTESSDAPENNGGLVSFKQ